MEIGTENAPEVELLLQEAHLARIRYDVDAARDYLRQVVALDKKNAEAWKILYELDGVDTATEEAASDDQQTIPDAKSAPEKPGNRRRRPLVVAGAVGLMAVGVLLTLTPFHEHGESILAPRSLYDRMHLNWLEDLLLGSAVGLGIMSAIYLRVQSSVDAWS